MRQGKNRRLANVKTRRETGLDHVMFNLDLNTPFGRKQLKEIQPYYPGEEEELREELGRVEMMIEFVKQNRTLTDKIQEVFMEVKDPSLTVQRSGSTTLSVVELYEVKSLLLQMRQLRKLTIEHEIGDYKGSHCISEIKENLTEGGENQLPAFERAEDEPVVNTVPEEYFLEDTEDLLNELDPRGDRMNTFYIYNEFSPLLGEYRGKKREYELLIRKEQKQAREELRKEYGIQLTPKFDIVVAKSHPDFEKIQNIKELEVVDQDYMSVTMQLKPTEQIYDYICEVEKINADIDMEEERIREQLSRKVSLKAEVLTRNCERMGALDLALARAIYSIKHDLVKPEIVEDHKSQREKVLPDFSVAKRWSDSHNGSQYGRQDHFSEAGRTDTYSNSVRIFRTGKKSHSRTVQLYADTHRRLSVCRERSVKFRLRDGRIERDTGPRSGQESHTDR